MGVGTQCANASATGYSVDSASEVLALIVYLSIYLFYLDPAEKCSPFRGTCRGSAL